MNPIISLVFLVTIVMSVLAIILSATQPIVDTAANEEMLRQAGDIMKFIDNSINDVLEEGIMSKRSLEFTSPGDFQSFPNENTI